MADSVRIEIVSPERLLLSEQAETVTAPGTEGYFTVMGDHAPLMTTLRPGFITVTGAGGSRRSFFVRGGLADVSPTGMTILADDARAASDFGRAEIEAEMARARDALASSTDADRPNSQQLYDGWANLLYEASHFEGQAEFNSQA